MTWWQYLLLVNLYLVLFYGFYALLLRKETFFQLNRIYLVSSALLAFLIPLIQAGWVQNLFITQKVAYTLYNNQVIIKSFTPVENAPVNWGQLFAGIYLTGAAFWLLKLVWQLVILKKIINKPNHDNSWSFFKKIKLGGESDNHHIITMHEQIHASQWHSVDVLVIELVMIINWFNPIVYFYRRAIKHIHEFIADSYAIKTAGSKTDYALLLLSQTFNTPQHQLLNHFFNNSLLKQRILMLQKNKSQRITLLKYGLSAPLFILMLVLSSATVYKSRAVTLINVKAQQVFASPALIDVRLQAPVKDAGGKTLMTIHVNNQSKQPVNIKLENDTSINQPVFSAVEQQPQFIGGQQAFSSFLASNIRYPAAMREHNIQGKVVVSFIIEKNGAVSSIKALDGPGFGAEEEAIRVVSLTSLKWVPGMQNNHYVRVQYILPVMFTLDGEVTAKTLVRALPDTGIHVVQFTHLTLTNGTNEPMYVLNGKQIKANDLKTINPDDIESIDILKDKAAILLYGSDAKNGVVIVKLKKKTQ